MTTTTTRNVIVNKDVANKKITVEREFDAPLEDLWKAWTQKELLDLWWAPKPYKAKTKSLDFREGGHWMYAMVGPDGDESWVWVNFFRIVPNKSFTAEDFFCNDKGERTYEFPGMFWNNLFSTTANGSKVTSELTFASEADLNKILELGFEPGFTAALGNLDELLADRG
jgi:uncharacterized protein YndB with AHSA1/START domain